MYTFRETIHFIAPIRPFDNNNRIFISRRYSSCNLGDGKAGGAAGAGAKQWGWGRSCIGAPPSPLFSRGVGFSASRFVDPPASLFPLQWRPAGGEENLQWTGCMGEGNAI